MSDTQVRSSQEGGKTIAEQTDLYGNHSLPKKQSLTIGSNAQTAQKTWLNAWEDPLANVRISPGCLITADLTGDGDFKIMIAQSNRLLRVFKGKTIISEMSLLDEPTAIEALYHEVGTPQIPMIAIASGPTLYIYRNLRPFYKFIVPPIDPSVEEADIWMRLQNDSVTADSAANELSILSHNGTNLCSRSKRLLQFDNPSARSSYVRSVKETSLQDSSPITCMSSLNKSSEEERAVSLAVLGTESGHIIILTQTAMKIAKQIDIGSVPAFLDTSGVFDVNYRIVVGCRNCRVYSIKNGKTAGNVIETESEVCGVLVFAKHVLVACMNDAFYGYNVKGSLTFTVQLPHTITAFSKFQLKRASVLHGAMIALSNGEVRLYDGNQVLASVSAGSAVVSMKFGQCGREDATLIMVTVSGSIVVKILQRQAQLDSKPTAGNNGGSSVEQDHLLQIPKRTQLYVDQMNRERENAAKMHLVFQRDLALLRLSTAREFIKVITKGQGTISNVGSNLRLSVQVLGMGPKFKIRLTFKNNSNAALFNVPVSLYFDQKLYSTDKSCMNIPIIVPSVNFHTDITVIASTSTLESAREIRIIVCAPNSSMPIINAVVVMPLTDSKL